MIASLVFIKEKINVDIELTFP